MSGITPVQSSDVQSSRFDLFLPEGVVQADQGLREKWILEDGKNSSFWLQGSRFIHHNETGVPALAAVWIVMALIHRRLKNTSWKSLSLAGLLTILGLGVSDLTSSALKHYWGRPKPFVSDDAIPPFPLSFPSNHSTNIAFFCTWIALVWVIHWPKPFRNWGLAGLLSLVVSVGLSRVLVGQHYPLDVLAGWALGSCLGVLLAKASSLLIRN
jgi:membrane-associated phospholipid phosphatase